MLRFAPLLCLFLLAGCASLAKTPPQPEIVCAGTPEYAQRAATFSITLDEARELCAAHRSANQQGLLLRARHCIIVGECWFFGAQPHKMGYSLSGYYVNGHTGEVAHEDRNVMTVAEYEQRGWMLDESRLLRPADRKSMKR
jgi:hypothetical protein